VTGNELTEIAIRLSGLPPRKSKQGYGALRWLSMRLDVNYTTVFRWSKGGNKIPKWAIDKLYDMEEESLVQDSVDS